MSYVKNFNPGQIHMDLPTANYIYELPLLSFGDVYGTVGLSLVFNRQMKESGDNPFNVVTGYKLNMQKRLIMVNGAPAEFQDESGRRTALVSHDNIYTFDDETQRILRKNGSTFKLEYSDYSWDIYDQAGKITAAYDKYDKNVYQYVYNASGQLTSIIYRASKTIDFVYTSGCLTSISYAGKTITLSGTANSFKVTHYAGMSYTLTTTSSSESYASFSATAADSASSSTVKQQVKIEKDGTDRVSIRKYIGGNLVDTTSYIFPDLYGVTRQYSLIDIVNNEGVKNRVHYLGEKVLYSYEVLDESEMFSYDKFNGEIQIVNTLGDMKNNNAIGKLARNDGVSMMKESASSDRWLMDVTGYYSSDVKGYYLLTGWIRATDDVNSVDQTICVSNHNGSCDYAFLPNVPSNTQWKFFAYQFALSANVIYVYPNSSAGVELKDLRLTYQVEEFLAENKVKTALIEDVLVSGDTVIPIREAEFYSAGIKVSDYGCISFDDLLKYKINQMKGAHTAELYCNHCNNIFTPSSTNLITVTYSGATYTLNHVALGKKRYTAKGMVTTRIYIDTSGNLAYEDVYVKTTDGTGEEVIISSQTVNKNLDVIASVADGVTTTYEWLDGLMVKETVDGLYERKVTYDTDDNGDPTITTQDEFKNITVYTLDPVWGVVKSVKLPNGTMVTDEYDDDMCAMTKRAFGNGLTTQFTYTDGNLSTLQQGENLNYQFAYDQDKLKSISKNDAAVEEHVYTGTTKVSSYYPSQANPLHSVTTEVDKYGRLVSVDGVLENTYTILPGFNSNGTLTHTTNNASALLAMSTDKLRGEVSRFRYNTNGQMISKSVTDKDDFTSKLSEETIDYDAVGRMTKHHMTGYIGSQELYFESDISYSKESSDPAANSRAKSYRYGAANSDSVSTEYEYDALSRLTQKTVTIDRTSFVKKLVYDQTRAYFCSETALNRNIGKNIYSFDEMGRIIGDSYSSADAAGDYRKYEYDANGRLMRENNKGLAKTYIYEYNEDGNLSSVKVYDYTIGTPETLISTIAFGYNGDQLISFNDSSISYNAMGCPVSYGSRTMSWAKGKLSRINQGSLSTGAHNYAFVYNAQGQRISKTYSYLEKNSDFSQVYVGQVLSESKNFYYDTFGRLVMETITRGIQGEGTESQRLIYLYDGESMVGVRRVKGNATNEYYFQRNLQGDVVSIYDTSGDLKVKYLYDAWGNCTIGSETTDVALAQLNPIRYRGYYYDTDTGLYYLNSRYYDPQWRRFISPDDTAYLDPETANGLSLYTYCNNDPVNYADPSGHFVITALMFWSAIGIAAASGAALALASTIAKDLENGQLFDGDITVRAYLGNALGGAIAGAGIGLCTVLGAAAGVALSAGTALAVGGTAVSGGGLFALGVGGAFVSGGLGYAARTVISDQEKFELSDMFIDAGFNAISGILTFSGAAIGGMLNIKVPGADFSAKNFALYHLGMAYFGVYPTKFILSYIKKILKERY